MTIDFAPPPPENHGFRRNSLRWFLRFYQRLRPEVVPELRSRVLPSYLVILGAGQGATQEQRDAFREALESWIHEFGLPHSADMIGEATLTLLIPAKTERQVFGWDSFRGSMKAMKREGSHVSDQRTYFPPFTFQRPGWIPAEESLEAAERRLKRDFERALSRQSRIWREVDRNSSNLWALWKRDREHVRHIRWLAYKQACPDFSLHQIVKRSRRSIRTVQRGLDSAAECLLLPQECIRKAQPGRKPRPL